MIVGGYAAKINGQGGEVVTCDQWQADFVTGQVFTRTGAQPFAGLYETATRGGGPLTAVKADYDKVDMDLMYVKTTDNQVTLYGKLAISDNDWIALATATVASDWMTLGNASRNSDWYQNFTYENIEYGAIDTATGLPAGEAKQDYNYVGANASAYTDAEGKEHFELNLSGYGNGGNASHYTSATSGGNGSFAVIYDKTKEYDYQNGRLELEADFTPTSAGGNGAGVGFMLYDADCNDANPFEANQRMFSILIRANGNAESKDCLMLQIRGGNGSGARIWGTGGAIDRSQYASFSEGFKLPPVWTNGAEPTFKLKYVFDNNTLTTYIDGVEFFKITDVANFIKTELDGDNDATEFNNRYPDGPVHAALFFNHERAYGTDRARVENFNVTYTNNADLLATEKADAKKAVSDKATEYGVEANADVLAQIDAVTERGKATALANAEIAKMKFAYDLATEKKTALDALNAYAVELGVEDEIPASITALITDITELGKAQDALVEAKGLLAVYANNPDCWEIIVASTKTLDEKYAAVDQTALTAKGIEDLNAAYETAKSTINALDNKDTAQSTANGAISAFEEVAAKVQGTVAVTFGANEAIDVKYGTVLSAVDASALTATKAEDAYYTYEFKGWKVNDDAVVSDIAVEAEFTAINKVVAVSGKAVDERGTALAGVTVSAVIDVDGKEATASTTTAEDGTYTFNVPVGDKTDITLAKKFYFSKATSYEGIKSEAQAIANAVMPWTFAPDGNGGTLTVAGNTLDANDLASTVDSTALSYDYFGENRNNYWLDTNLAVGEAISFSFKWNERQGSDRDPYMKMKYGNVDNLGINSMGTSFSNWDTTVSGNNTVFDFGGPKDITAGTFYGKVYDYLFVREEGTLKMYGKHGGAAKWVHMATENIAATNTDTKFCFGYSTWGHVNYDFSLFNAKKQSVSDLTLDSAKNFFTGSWASGAANADGTYSLWSSFANEGNGTAHKGATNAAAIWTPGSHNIDNKRVTVTTDALLGTDFSDNTMGLAIAGNGKTLVLGFRKNGIMIQLAGGNGYSRRHWSVSASTAGVDYLNNEACPTILTKNGKLERDSVNLKYEIEGTYASIYVDGVLAFAGDIVEIMTKYTGGENSNYATSADAYPVGTVQIGFLANHESYTWSSYYALENFKISLADVVADNATAIANAKTDAIAKINAIDVSKLSPAGKEYYEANKATVIDAINAYTAVEGASLTKTVAAIEEIAAPVLVVNNDYEVFIAGYGTVEVKWGTTIASLIEGKTASSFGDNVGYFYNTDGKFGIYTDATKGLTALAGNETIKRKTRIYPSSATYLGGTNDFNMEDCGSENHGFMIGGGSRWVTNKAYTVKGKTLTVRATFDSWNKGTSKIQGLGFIFRDNTTGKVVSVTTDYNTNLFYVFANTGNGWGSRLRLPNATNAPLSKAINTNTAFGGAKFDMQIQITGNTWKIWVGAVNANFNDSNVNYVVNDMYAWTTTDTTAGGGVGTIGVGAGPTVETAKEQFANIGASDNFVVGINFFADGAADGYYGANVAHCKVTNFTIKN